MRRGHRPAVLAAAVVALALAPVAGCGDDDDGTATGAGATTTLAGERERDRDRDRVHQTVEDIADACHDQDRDRLRDHVADQHHDRIRDGSCAALAGAVDVEVTVDDITVTGDEATATVRLRVHHQDGSEDELHEAWRFRWHDGRWELSEVPPMMDPDAGTPSTMHVEEDG